MSKCRPPREQKQRRSSIALASSFEANFYFISSRTNGKKRRENTERRAERGAQKKTERVGRTHLTSPVYTQFRRFRRAKKEEDLASSFLVVFGFLPPEFLRHSLPAIFIDRDACVAKIFRSGERNNKTPKEKETKPFISDLSLDETTR